MTATRSKPDTDRIPNHHHPLVKSVAYGLRRRCGVTEKAHILVAVSGGGDSVALLRALHALKDRRRWRLTLTVGHVQHHLRGDEAEADARFVAKLSDDLELPVLRRDLNLSAEAGNVEAAARRARYQALAEMAQECGASYIATAHHGDDQLETLLMRMLRGAGTRGMRGIAWRRSFAGDASPHVIRPMLAVTRAEVFGYLNALGQPWREDHTNTDVTRWRARLRADVLPVLEAIRPGAGTKAGTFADHLRDVHKVLDDAVEDAHRLVERDGTTAGLDRLAGKRLRRVVLSGLIRELLIDAGVPADKIGARQVARVVRAVRDAEGGERSFAFGGGVVVRVTRERVTAGRDN